MKLTEGEDAVDFSVEDINGKLISLRDFRGKKLLLSFYRYSECIYCNLRLHELMKKYDDFNKKGLEKVAFFQSSKTRIEKYAGKLNPPFSIVSDTQRKVYRMYRVEENSFSGYLKGYFQILRALKAFSLGYIPKTGEGSKTLIPADFLISEDGKIFKAYYGKDISDHIPFEEIEKFLLAPKKIFPHKNISFFQKK